jgi:hypothetical protein
MAALDVPAASLRSENCRVKSAVEMAPAAALFIIGSRTVETI